MTIDAGAALRQGYDDLASTRGAVVYLLFAAFTLASLPFQQTLTRETTRVLVEFADVPTDQVTVAPTPLALDIDPTVLAGALAAIFLVGEALRVVGIRSFASESDRPIPTAEVTAGGPSTYAVLLVTSLVVQVAVYGGIAALVIPGLIAAVLTVFVRQSVLLGDEGVVGAIKESVSIVVDETVPVIAVLAALIGISLVAGVPTLFLDPATVASPLVGALVATIVTVYGVAVVTRAYQQATETDDAVSEPLDADDLADGDVAGGESNR